MNRPLPETCFQELLQMADVNGVALLPAAGGAHTIAFPEAPCPADTIAEALVSLVARLAGAVEAEFVFEYGRLYLRGTAAGTLVVLLDPFASVALVRLQCDVLIPALEGRGNGHGRRRLWRRGRN